MAVGVMWSAAGAAAHSGGSAPGPTGKDWLSPVLPYIHAAVPYVAAAAAAAVLLGLLAAARTLRLTGERTALWALPTPTYAPAAEDVRRWASAVSASRRPGPLGAVTRRAEATRFRLTLDNGRVVQFVESTPRVLSQLRDATMGGVEMKAAELPAPAGGEGVKLRRYRMELRLHRDGSHALAALEMEPDPLGPLASALGELDELEWAEVVVDLLPLAPDAKRKMLKRTMRTEGKGSGGGWQKDLRDVVGILEAGKKGDNWLGLGDGGVLSPVRSTIASIEDRTDDRARHAKLASPEPAFGAQVLIATAAPTRARARAVARSLVAGFAPYTDRNRWRPAGVIGGSVGGAQSWLRRSHFDLRLRTGLFLPRSRSIVVTGEVAPLMKPPTATCASSAVARSGGLVPPPPARLPDYVRGAGLVPLGIVTEHGQERLVGTLLAAMLFDLHVGKTRSGKTEQMVARFLAAVDTPGVGACYFDPHADAVALSRSYLLGHADRVLEIDLSRENSKMAGLNLLSMTGKGPQHIGAIAQTVAGGFAATLDWDVSKNNRSINMVVQATSAVCELNLHLPPELQGTVFLLPILLRDQRWRDAILPYLGRQSVEFLTDGLGSQTGGKEAIGPTTNLIDNLRRSRQVAAVLGQPETTFDLRRAMDTGQIVLLCPTVDGEHNRLVHALLLFELRRVAMTRLNLPLDQRRAFHVYADEMQVGDQGAGSDLMQGILRETGKVGLRFHGATQQPSALNANTRATFLTNGFAVCANTLGNDDAAVIVREWGKAVDPEVLRRMPAYSYLASIIVDGALSRPFLVRSLPVRDLWGPPCDDPGLIALEAAIDRNMRRRPVQEVVDALDDHASAILTYLKGHDPKPRPSGTTSAADRRRPRVTRPAVTGSATPPAIALEELPATDTARARARRRWTTG